ncbi:SpoIIE family protein phosphatase [Kitasatospora sp. NPDC050463]|uniref:SpoIIE family protein phosphatase n=1 Tax=Kitasatospora sp. NPDC050463 TaxID=3155786 RepID=UPI0033CA04E1
MTDRATAGLETAGLRQSRRLHMLRALCAGLTAHEMLCCVADQAMAELGGFAGMVHWSGGQGGGRRLRLVAVSGLPRPALQEWAEIAEDDIHSALAIAFRDDGYVCMPAVCGVRPLDGEPVVAMVAAVPLAESDAQLGTLSVLTAQGEPTPAQRTFLDQAARWVVTHVSSPEWVVDRRGLHTQPVGSDLRMALDAVQVGSWQWNISTGDMSWDDVGLGLLGVSGAGVRRLGSWADLVYPDDLPKVMAAVEESLRTGDIYEADYRIRRPDGTTRWMRSRGRPVPGDRGEPERVVGTVWDTTESRIAPQAVGDAMRYMGDAFLGVDRNWLITFLSGAAEHLLGRARDIVGRGLWEGPAGQVAGLEERCRQAAADNVPVAVDFRWPTDGRWYHMRLAPHPEGLTAYLTDVTDDRTRAARREADRRARATWPDVAEQSGPIGALAVALSEAVTMQDVVDVLAGHVMPRFGSAGLLVQVVGEGRLHVVGAVGYSEDHIRSLERLPLSGSGPVEEVTRTRKPRFIGSPAEWAARYPWLAHLLGTSGKQAWAFLPVIASGQPIGCCVLSYYEPRRFTREERELLTVFSGMFAQALSRARLYDLEHARAKTLQHALLPRALPSTPALTTAARYLPASSTEVGGDWYDIIPLSADRVALVIGDVMGHGLAQAATMGRLRTAVHTLADLDLPPGEILAHLNDLFTDLGDEFYATCLYAVYDSVTGDCSIARAGHPPPAVILPDGSVSFSDLVPDPPLGAAEPPFTSVRICLPEGSRLVLYTDGLVESASRDIDSGMAELARVLTGKPVRTTTAQGDSQAELEQLCDAVTGTLLPAGRETADDTALLVAYTHRLPPDAVACWELSDGPVAAGEARTHVREQLGVWALDDLVMAAELLASELVGNVVRHAKGPARLRLLRSRTLVCEVSDRSAATPRIRRATDADEGGRGLQLVAALSQRWGTRYTSDGKCIWTELPLPQA